MQKVLDFLERYVQWVAIAIAAVFLGFALWSYLPVVATPVTLTLDGKPLTPGEVDPEIKQAGDALQNRIDAPQKVKIDVPDFRKRLTDELNQKNKPVVLPRTLMNALPVEYPKMPWGAASGSTGTESDKVNELPKLPPVVLEPEPTTDFAQVTVAAAGAVAPAGTASPVPATPGLPGMTPAAGTAVAANATDTTWVRVPFTVPAGNIARAFTNVNIPLNLQSSTFLRFELIREKQLPGGGWGPEEVVDPLPTIAMPVLPPDGAANVAAQQQYIGWANSNQGPIVQPEFFPVVAGTDPRFIKPAETAGTAGSPNAFDAENYPAAGMPGGDMAGLTEEQKAAVRAARQRKAKEAADKNKNNGGGGGTRPRGGSGGGRPGGAGGGGGGPGGRHHFTDNGGTGTSNDSSSNDSGVVPFRAPPTNGPPGMPPGGTYPGANPGAIDGSGGGMFPGAASPQAPGSGQRIAFTPVPPAPFRPDSIANGVVEGWAYDVTAAADSTYRYRVRYRMYNPIFGVQNVASTPALTAVFSLVGEDTNGWTAPLTIAPLTHVYLAALPTSGSSRVAFQVFRWQAGKRHKTTVYVGPGDSIGKVEGDIDYRTHWTLVEVRRDTSSNNPYALLMNADGILKRLDFDVDRGTPLYMQLISETDGAPAVTPGAPPFGGGTPAVGSGRPTGGRPGGNDPPVAP